MGKIIQGLPPFSENFGLYLHSALQRLRVMSNTWIEGYNQLFSIGPEAKTEYFRSRGLGLARKGKFAEAVPLLKQSYRQKPDDAEVAYYLGRSCLKTGLVEEGIRYLEEGLEKDPANPRLPAIIAMAHIKAKRYTRAAELLEDAIARGMNEFDIYYRLGIAYDHLGELDKAIAAFRLAIEKRPEYPKVYRYLGFALEQKGEHAEAVRHLKQALELEEGDK